MMRMRQIAVSLGLALLLLLLGCERGVRNMYYHNRVKTEEPSSYFPDGMSARPLPSNTVVHGNGVLASTSSGRRQLAPLPESAPAAVPTTPSGGLRSTEVNRNTPLQNPYPITLALLRRGQERFNIYCAPCHSMAGDGDGMVARRGFPHPPTYHSDRLRNAPDKHFYDVITHGYGIMYSYASRVEPADRWAIIAYIRALQLSQHAPLAMAPAAVQARLKETQ